MRGGGRRGGTGRGGGREGRYGRRDAPPGGAVSRDDRDRRDRRPGYSPRRHAGISPRRRSPSPARCVRRPKVMEDNRDVTRGNHSPTDGDRDRHRGGRISRSGGRSLPLGRGDSIYNERRDDGRRDSIYTGRGDSIYYGGNRDLPPDGRRDDYGSLRDLPRDGCRREGYEREGKDPGGAGDFSVNRDSEYIGSPGGRRIFKDREAFGDDGMTLRISATGLGRTTTLYHERGSSRPQAALSPPPPLYPSVLPADTGFTRGGSAMKTADGFITGRTPLLHNDNKFRYGDHLRDPYFERTRVTERHYSGDRDALVEEDGGNDSLYPAMDMPIRGDREIDSRYSGRGMLGSDLKQIGDSSSSLVANERQYKLDDGPDFDPSIRYVMNGPGMPPHDSLGHGRVRDYRFSRRSLENGSDHGDQALDIARQEHSKLAPRAESRKYDRNGYVTRDPVMDTYVASDYLNGNVSHNPRHLSGSASMTGIKDERFNHHLRPSRRMAEDEDRYQDMLHESQHNQRDSYGIHASVGYPPARSGPDRYSRSPGFEPIGTARRPARQHDFSSFEDGHDLSDREVPPTISRKRDRSRAFHYSEMDTHQADDQFDVRGYNDMDEDDLSPGRMSDYDMLDEDVRYSRYDLPSNRNVFSRLGLPYEISGEWTGVEQGHAYGHSKRKPLAQRISRPIAHSSMHGRGRGVLSKSGKKRMKVTPRHFDSGYTSPGNEFTGPNKYPKSSEEKQNNPNESEMDNEDTPEGEDLQKDPPEGSEEFTKQVHQAFLKYTKIINESPAMQKKFRDVTKGPLTCCVCGSIARKFSDLDALVSHAYDTCKVGLKTKHLGFHKALCVLMGWNWHVAPHTSKSHHSIAAEEVSAMKGDLILWPPVVVVHNSSIAINANDTESKIVSKEDIEGLLADIRIPLEKVKVSHGLPTNQSVFLVKFQPTISGFQEAMRIHNHFSAKNHGKEEFQHMRDGKGKQAAPIDNLEELLYGHIAVAEDLGYLDNGTKKRCVIKSKREIEASAEAMLNLES